MDDQINQINTQIAFTSALLFAISLNIYTSIAYKDLLINQNQSQFTIKKIYKISVLSANITLVVTIYFLIITYIDYESEPSISSKNFLLASIFSLSAQSLRTYTLLKYPNEIFGVEDII